MAKKRGTKQFVDHIAQPTRAGRLTGMCKTHLYIMYGPKFRVSVGITSYTIHEVIFDNSDVEAVIL